MTPRRYRYTLVDNPLLIAHFDADDIPFGFRRHK